jgi:phage-related protein (TIGR01555 family)
MSIIGKAAKAIEERVDSWVNAMTGLGSVGRDKLKANVPQRSVPLDDYTLDALFHDDDIAQRISRSLPEHAMGQGFRLADETGDADGEESRAMTKLVRPALRKWGAAAKLLEGDVWGRHYGGAAILLGVDGSGAQWEPLDDEKIKKGGLKFLTVLDRRRLWVDERYNDEMKPKFGEPKIYRVQRLALGMNGFVGNTGQRVHESRFIFFGGAMTADIVKLENRGWDLSVLQRVFDVLQAGSSNWQSVSHLMTDISQGVMKIEGLIKMLASKEELATRLELMDLTRATNRTILLDAKMEDYERKPTPMGGIPEILDRTFVRVAAAAEMPVTILFKQSPAGLNATGQSDMEQWYNDIGMHQETVLCPRAERLTRVIALSEGVSLKPGWSVVFPSPRRMTQTEQAAFRKTVAETDAIYIDKGVLLPEEVTLARSKGGQYSADFPAVDLDVRRAALDKELAKLEDDAGKSDPVPPTLTQPGGPPKQLPPKQPTPPTDG